MKKKEKEREFSVTVMYFYHQGFALYIHTIINHFRVIKGYFRKEKKNLFKEKNFFFL